MSEYSKGDEGLLEDEKPDLESDHSEDIEQVMREALDAVERVTPEPSDEDTSTDDAEPLVDVVGRPDDAEGSDLHREIAELRERSIRTLADFDNFRKRVDRERLQLNRFSGFELIRELLEILDNLHRAAESDGQMADLKLGVEMIVRQVEELLRRHGVSKVKTEQAVFDPNVHDAVSRKETEEVVEPTVTAEHQGGYLMHDRLLRPARVEVAVPIEGTENNAASSGSESEGAAGE